MGQSKLHRLNTATLVIEVFLLAENRCVGSDCLVTHEC